MDTKRDAMRLFKFEVVNLKKRQGRDVIVYAETMQAAKARVAARFPGWEIRYPTWLAGEMHFVISDWTTD